MADLALFGAPADVLDAVSGDDGLFEVWPENMPLLEAFLRLRTQWNVTMGGVTGLNYQSAEMMLRLLDLFTRENFIALQEMEAAALAVMLEDKGT